MRGLYSQNVVIMLLSNSLEMINHVGGVLSSNQFYGMRKKQRRDRRTRRDGTINDDQAWGWCPYRLRRCMKNVQSQTLPKSPGNPFSVSCRALKKCQGIIKPVQGRSDLPLGSGHWSNASVMLKFFQDRKALKLYQPYLLMYHTYYHSQSSSPAKKIFLCW